MAHPLFVRHPGLQQGGAMDQDGPHQFSELSLRSKHGRRPRQRYPATMAFLPFALRRPWLLVRDLVVDRGDPDLEALGRLTDPERFLWAILPHAARTFSASIAMLPARSAKASAVAYLYCRMLDTYEDLVPQVAAREGSFVCICRSIPAPRLGRSPEITPQARGAHRRLGRPRSRPLG